MASIEDSEFNMGGGPPINPLGQESELSFPREFESIPIKI